MIKKFLNKMNEKAGQSVFDHVGKCPKCGNNLLESGDFWSCEGLLNQSCTFSISRYTDNGTPITLEMINICHAFHTDGEIPKFISSAFDVELLSKSDIESLQAGFLKGANTEQQVVNHTTTSYTSKSQQEVATQEQPKAETVVTQEQPKAETVTTQEQPKVKQEVAATQEQPQNKQATAEDKRANFFKNGRKLANPCTCGGDVYRYGNWAACNKCNLKISTKYEGLNFSDAEMSQLIGKRISHFKTFKTVCSNGSPLKGRVFIELDSNGNLSSKYKFVNSPVNLNDFYRKMLFAPDKDGRTEIPVTELIQNKGSKNNNSNNNANSTNNNSGSNTQSKNNTQNNVDSGNKPNNPVTTGDGTINKFNPFENASYNNGSVEDEYEKYLSINDESVPF